MAVKLANNASGRLAANITASETTIILQAGNGATFPSLSGNDWFPATLVRADSTFEIVRVTARNGDILTVVRGQEGTQPISFLIGDRAELRLTEGALNQFTLDRSVTVGTTPGTVAAGNDIRIVGAVQKAQNLNDIPNKAAARTNIGLGNVNNTADKDKPVSDATAAAIARASPAGLICMWSGSVSAVPDGWALCDGQNGTPDLRNRFVVAAGGSYSVGSTGDGSIPSHTHGAGTLAAASAGAHTHTGTASSAGAHSHTASTNNTGEHTHLLNLSQGGQNGYYPAPSMGGTFNTPMQTGSSGGHTHTVTVNSGGAHTHSVTTVSAGAHAHSITGSTGSAGAGSEVIAKYYALAYIMKL